MFLTSEFDILHPGDVDGVELVRNGKLINVETERLPLCWTQPGRIAAEVLSTLELDAAR
ncbi:hypothetical protein [Amycolatopsis alkalitolerans]|uniref:hypothetical protein n=1 Tax=Amycolatopsis alkalitolerans TaxID=2547244 RepID=UPI00135869E1|nr:hypothetical protein [Amycolatopsis alkalitolerans]